MARLQADRVRIFPHAPAHSRPSGQLRNHTSVAFLNILREVFTSTVVQAMVGTIPALMSTLFQSPPYDPARERRRKRVVVIVIVAAVLAVAMFFRFRNWPYEHVVHNFFQAIEQQDYEKAYGIWMHDPAWKQHPNKYKDYPFGEFQVDWGPGGEWGLIKEYQIDGVARPKHGSGVVVVVTVNQRADKARIWVEKKDKTLTFSPY